jgi:hypothetical protein
MLIPIEVTQSELARHVEANTSYFLDSGELALLYHAGKLRLAEIMSKDVGLAGDAFSNEYSAFCERRAKKAMHLTS